MKNISKLDSANTDRRWRVCEGQNANL